LRDIYTWLTDRGFHYRGDFDRLMSPVDGRVLQVDAIFDRRTMADTCFAHGSPEVNENF